MQTLGISDSTPRSENRFRALLWPTIRNEVDLDYISRQGFWVCFIAAIVTGLFTLISREPFGLADALFFFLAGTGVRQRSQVAGFSAFLVYLVTTGISGISIGRIIFIALLLANVRGTWLAARWPKDELPPPRLAQTFGDKISDQMPSLVWPKTRYLFYVLAVIELLGSGIVLAQRFAHKS